jgi:mRNA-degrading endonuclease RelE of RelBE toxin-antitoxin system
MKYVRTPQFRKDYDSLPPEIKTKVHKAFKLFKQDPHHPSLQTRKIRGPKGIWEGRIDRFYRFTFHFEEGTVVFRRVGRHEIVERDRD